MAMAVPILVPFDVLALTVESVLGGLLGLFPSIHQFALLIAMKN